jgi:1-acyl-sn-glycerol-3-phosphate acyltransferase
VPERAARGAGLPPRAGTLDLFARSWRALYEFGYLGLQGVTHLMFRPFFRIRRVGPRTPLPEGGVLLCPNHESYLDPAMVQIAAPRRRLVFVMTNDFYSSPAARWFFRLVGALPIARGRLAWRSVRRATALLRMGRAIVVFPEGRLSREGEMSPAQRGVSVLARAGRAPVVPVAILGSRRAWPRGARWFSRANVRVAFGEPIAWHGRHDREGEQAFADEVLERVRALRARYA